MFDGLQYCSRIGVEVEAKVIKCPISEEGLDFGVLNVLDIAVVSGLGDTGLLQVGLGFSQAMEDDLRYETEN